MSKAGNKSGLRMTLVELIIVILIMLLLITIASRYVLKAREAARRSQSRSNLRQIGLALYNYHETFQAMPPGGVFNAKGIPYHCWTTAMSPYLEASPWYAGVNLAVPWDDPTQVDHFSGHHHFFMENPRANIPSRADGFPQTSYSGNSWIFHRNSSVTLKQIGDLQSTLLAAETRGRYLPLGCPGNWRDVHAGFNNSEDSFGLRDGDFTLIGLADGSAREVGPQMDPAVWNALAGAETLRPTADRLERTPYPYELPRVPYWRSRTVWDGKSLTVRLRLSPDGLNLDVHIGHGDKYRGSPHYAQNLDELNQVAGIQHVKFTGTVDVSDLDIYTRLKNLKTLTLSKATVSGDLDAFRKQLDPTVTVD